MTMTVLQPAMKIALDCRLPIKNHHDIYCVATSQTFKEYNCLYPTPSPPLITLCGCRACSTNIYQ